jgi:hypothetical protein
LGEAHQEQWYGQVALILLIEALFSETKKNFIIQQWTKWWGSERGTPHYPFLANGKELVKHGNIKMGQFTMRLHFQGQTGEFKGKWSCLIHCYSLGLILKRRENKKMRAPRQFIASGNKCGFE